MTYHDNFATRVLEADVDRHGPRFVQVEFAAATIVSALLAVAVTGAAFVRGDAPGAATGSVFFLGVAINSYAVTRWVTRCGSHAETASLSLSDVATFAVATLVPGVLALSLRRR